MSFSFHATHIYSMTENHCANYIANFVVKCAHNFFVVAVVVIVAVNVYVAYA